MDRFISFLLLLWQSFCLFISQAEINHAMLVVLVMYDRIRRIVRYIEYLCHSGNYFMTLNVKYWKKDLTWHVKTTYINTNIYNSWTGHAILVLNISAYKHITLLLLLLFVYTSSFTKQCSLRPCRCCACESADSCHFLRCCHIRMPHCRSHSTDTSLTRKCVWIIQPFLCLDRGFKTQPPSRRTNILTTSPYYWLSAYVLHIST